jgi:hypothetical protein
VRVSRRDRNCARISAPKRHTRPAGKDTVQVGPNEIVRVIVRFDDYEGMYPYHCHIVEHEDHGMMRAFQVVLEPPRVAMLTAGAALLGVLAVRSARIGCEGIDLDARPGTLDAGESRERQIERVERLHDRVGAGRERIEDDERRAE